MPDHAHPAPPSGHARTLIEAFLYLDLTAHGLDPDQSPDFTTLDHDPAAVSRQAVLTEEEDAWRVRLGDVEVLVPYASESEARSEDLTFGSGLSELIDPGQWALIAVTYGNRALEASSLRRRLLGRRPVREHHSRLALRRGRRGRGPEVPP